MRKVSVTYEAYKFSELSKAAQERVLEKFYDINVYDSWWDSAYERFIEDLRDLGLTVDKKKPFYFDLGRAQSFTFNELRVSDADTLLSVVCPDVSSHVRKVASEYITVSSSRSCGRSYSFEIDERSNDRTSRLNKALREIEETLNQFLNDLSHKFLYALEREYDYLTSREEVLETIECNEYEFHEDGTLAYF